MITEEVVNGRRFYYDTDTGQKVPSVTTVTSLRSPFSSGGRPGKAAAIGSLLHYHIEKDIRRNLHLGTADAPDARIWGNGIDEEVWMKIQAGLRMWKKLGIVFENPRIETVFFNGRYGYAGRIDILDDLDNNHCVVYELKSGDFYDHYELQGAAYAHAVGADKVVFVQCDINPVRNPDQVGKIIEMGREDINSKFAEFIETLQQFYLERQQGGMNDAINTCKRGAQSAQKRMDKNIQRRGRK